MMPGLLAWGGAYAAFALLLPQWSGPGHLLHGYFLYLAICFAPWSIWFYWMSWKRDAATAASVIIQGAVVAAVTFPIHIIATHRQFWTYFEDRDALLGIRMAGVPVEEYFFYPFMINMAMLLYFWLTDLMKARRIADFRINRSRLWAALLAAAVAFYVWAGYEWFMVRDVASVAMPAMSRDTAGVPHFAAGPRDCGWAILCLASTGTNLLGLWFAERFTPLHLKAMLLGYPIFFLICFLSDVIGVSRGWWVFNDQSCTGIWLGGVPLEDPIMYVTGMTLSLSVFSGCRRALGART